MTSDADLWHQVHAQREDGVSAMFLIRDVEPRPDQPQIFVVELPYPITDLSKLPDAAGYRRLDAFQEQWIEPACAVLGWTFVAWKSEDGSFFLYLYGSGDPNALLEKLAPFDGSLAFFNDRDAEWSEYAALRELVDQAEAGDEDGDEDDDELDPAHGEGSDTHVHTADCDHDHDAGATSDGIPVIDRAADSSARITARDVTRNIVRPTAAEPDPATVEPTTAGSRRAKASAARPKPAARATTAAKAKPAARAKAALKAKTAINAKAALNAKTAAKAKTAAEAKPAAKVKTAAKAKPVADTKPAAKAAASRGATSRPNKPAASKSARSRASHR